MDKAIDVAALPKTELPLFLNPVHAVSKPTPLGLAGLSEAPEDPEFRVQAFPTTHPHVVVWARMGGGKTFRAREYAKSLGVESALFVTPRQVFSYSIQDGFLPVFPDLRHYKDTEGDPYQAPYLVVQLESLFKVKPEGYDLVILDECESVLSQMKSDTNTEFEQVYAMFEHILRSAKYSLWMDAFLSDRTLTTLKLLLPPKDICVVHNTYVDRVRRAVMLEVPPPPKRKKGEKPKKKKLSPRKKVLLKCFLDLARQNKRVVCMVGSVSFAQQLKEALKEAHPDQRVLVITRNASDKIKKANVEELWVKYDHIIYTSTVTVGTSFDPEIPHFHCALAYFSANSIRPRDMLQGLQRVRKLIDNVLYYVVSNSYCGHDRHPQFDLLEIREHLEKRTKHEEAHSKIAHHYPEWIKNLMARNQLEDNTSAYHHGELVHTLLEDAGYIIDLENSPALAKTHVDEESLSDGLLVYSDIADIFKKEGEELRKQEKAGNIATEGEKIKLRKFDFQTYIYLHVQAKEAGVDLDDAFKEYQKNTATMENTKKNMKMELYRELDVSALLSDRARHAEVIEELCALLGVKHSLDIDHKIDANTVVRVGQHVRANSKKIWDIFGVGYSINSKHSPERQASDVLNAIFNRWGLTRLVKTERRQKRAPNGKLMEAPGVYQLRFQAKWMEYLRCARIDTIRYARARGQIIGDEDGPGVL